MLSQRDIDIMWLEAMEEIDEVEAEFMETLRGKDGSTETSRTRTQPETALFPAPPPETVTNYS